MHIKKFLLSGLVIVMFIFYALYQRSGNKPISQPAVNLGGAGTAPANVGAIFKDGQFVGAPADAYYGNIQVKAVIQGGKIADVQFLDYPQDRQNSVYINTQAMPLLKAEAIQAQSSKVDIVSGATDTSYAFIQSLASALNQALAPGQTPSAPSPSLTPSVRPPRGGEDN